MKKHEETKKAANKKNGKEHPKKEIHKDNKKDSKEKEKKTEVKKEVKKEEKKEEKNNNDNSFIIRIKILKLGKTTISHNKDEKKEETYENIDNSIYSLINNAFNNSSFNNSYSNYHNSSDMSESTTYDSKSHIYFRNLILENINEKKFNSIRASFCIKYKFYDIPLAHEVNDFNYPPKYTINEKYFAFVYPNEILTYCITISGILYNDKKSAGVSAGLTMIEVIFQILAIYYADPSKAEKELGWKATKNLEDMCRDSWNFIKKNK